MLAGLLLLLACADPVVQTPACAEWVACIQARDAQLGVSTDNRRFERGGACWGGEEGAALCDRGCTRGLVWLREADLELPEACL